MAKNNQGLRRRLAASVAIYAALAAAPEAYAQAGERDFNIPAGDLSSALKAFGAATGTPVVYSPDLVRNRTSPGVRGHLDRETALKAVLASNGLTYSYSNAGAIMIKPAMAPQAALLSSQTFRQDAPAPVAQAIVEPDEPAEVETIVVSGIRSSMRSAMNTKKNTAEVVDSIAAQDIGKLPDPNVADTLSRVPGVQLYRFAGEGVYASVRGLVDQNRTEYNGRSAYSPDSAVGGGRDFQPDNAMPELISGIDIYKNPSAERIEGAIGGLVNIKTYKPFDFSGLTFIGSAKVNHYDLADRTKPTIFGLVSNRWDTSVGEFGALLAASYSKTAMRQDAVTTNNYSARSYLTYGVDKNGNGVTNSAATPNTDRDDQVLAPNGWGQQMLYGGRERKGFEVSLAWRPNSKMRFYLDGTRSEYLYDENNPVLSANLAAAGAPVSNLQVSASTTTVTAADVANGSTLPLGSTIAGYNFEKATYSNVIFSQLRNSFFDEMNQSIIAAGGSWQATDRLQVSGEFGYTDSEEIKTTRALNLVTDPTEGYTVTQDLTGEYQDFTIAGGAGPLADPTNWFFQSYGKQYNPMRIKETSTRFDARYDLDADSWLQSVRGGIRLTDLSYMFDRSVTNWTIHNASGTTNANLISLASTPQLADHLFNNFMRGDAQGVSGFASIRDQDLNNDARLVAALPTAYRIVNGGRVNGVAAGDPPLDPTLHFAVDEKTSAAYGVADYRINPMGINVDGNVGVRVVKTEGTARGYQAAPQSYAYTDVLPSLNARAELKDNLFLRLGLSKGVTRPGFKTLNPSITTVTTGLAPGSTPLVTIGNPNLGPQRSKNIDVSLEYYFSPTGYAYLSAFHKDITGFITNFAQFEDLGFKDTAGNPILPLVTRPINGAAGTIDGVELGVQTFFDTLPSPWDGLGVQANYTYVDSAVDVPLGSAAAPKFVTTPLPFLSKNAFNLVLMYEKAAFSGRLAYGWRDDYLRFQFGGGLPNTPVITPAYGTLDASVNYSLTPSLTVTAEATNLLDTAPDRYAGQFDIRPVAQYSYDRRFALGVRYRFGGQ